MASKKHRPIVMNPYRKQSKTRIIVKRVILVTVILAMIEVAVLYVIHKRNAAQTAANQTTESLAQIPAEKKDTSATKKAIPFKQQQSVKKDSVAKKDVAEITRPALKTTVFANAALVRDTAIKKETTLKKNRVVKPVSSEKMVEILNQVKIAKPSNSPKCISIQIVSNSNAENGFKIANYLRSNGFIISGREVIPGNQKGIQIESSETCLKLIVGDL